MITTIIGVLGAIVAGVLNALRGQDRISRALIPFVLGCIAVDLYYHTVFATGVAAGVWLMLAPGWSLSAIHGWGRDWKEKEIVTGHIVDRLPIKDTYLYGTMGMSIRWAVWSIPLFVFLAYSTGGLAAYHLITWLVGPVYYLSGRYYNYLPTQWVANRLSAANVAEFVSLTLVFGCILFGYML